MGIQHLVRVGAMALVGRFSSADSVVYPRGTRVVTRTRRGLEIGQVLVPPVDDACDTEADGTILRAVSVEDMLLEERLERNRSEALDSCAELLQERGIEATLLDVECLFDGQNVLFYFLGEVPAAASELTAELAATYDAQVKMQQFADTLLQGCGPDCGTEKAEGACGSCSTCAVAAACGTGAH